MTCTKSSKDGTCCDRCAAGEYMKAECDSSKATECAKCDCGFYTATKNNLHRCLACKECISKKHQRKVKDCTNQENTVCECVAGFYCNNEQCDYCLQVSHCPPGEGVKVPATRMNDTICHPCGDKTYSNVTDFLSPCKTHTRCEDFGRLLNTPGTQTTDAICGNFKSHFPWILPAGLWSGLVLTALVLFGLVCWRAKRKSNKAAGSNVPVTLVERLPATPITSLDLPLPFTELNGHCQENCIVECYKLPLFNTDYLPQVSGVTQDNMDSFLPTTPLKPSVSFAESSHTNGSAGYCTSNFLRSYSEPQEDEWCGT